MISLEYGESTDSWPDSVTSSSYISSLLLALAVDASVPSIYVFDLRRQMGPTSPSTSVSDRTHLSAFGRPRVPIADRAAPSALPLV